VQNLERREEYIASEGGGLHYPQECMALFANSIHYEGHYMATTTQKVHKI